MGIIEGDRIGFWSFYYKNAKFQMYCDKGEHVLVELIRDTSEVDSSEVFIPHTLYNGERIDSLGGSFCSGSFSKIIIDDDISVKTEAFSYAQVKEVVWPKNCTEIPERCFYRSSVEKVTNVYNVTSIGKSAFERSSIVEFEWPFGCDTIPSECFANSLIERLSNTDHITTIGNKAFESSSIVEFAWPSKCTSIPKKCFKSTSLRKISNIDHVTEIGESAFEFAALDNFTWPSSCKVIPLYCFYGSSLKSISNISNVETIRALAFCNVAPHFSADLSDSAIFEIAPQAFFYCDPQKVRLPYYISEDEKQKIFTSENNKDE